MTVAPFRLRDLTMLSPVGYRVRPRRLAEIKAAVEHQMGVGTWREANASFAQVAAHFVIHTSGLVSQLHPITQRLRVGSGHANEWCITIENEGNFPTRYHRGRPVWWEPEKFGSSVLGAAQIEASRALLAYLAEQVPGLQVGTHRQLDESKAGCCGPDLWREVGQWGVDLGMPEMPTNGGLPIPDDWRRNPSEIPNSSIRAYTGPLEPGAANLAP